MFSEVLVGNILKKIHIFNLFFFVVNNPEDKLAPVVVTEFLNGHKKGSEAPKHC
jgi:hypothetical protein